MHELTIRAADPAELPEIGRLRVSAYQASGFLLAPTSYTAELAALGGAGDADVLVALAGGEIVGTVAMQSLPQPCEIAASPDEVEVRALAVTPAARGRGVGRALLDAVIDATRRRGAARVVLCTVDAMAAARRMYAAAGFRRMPERDWSTPGGVVLVSYALDLPPADVPSATGP